jgi:DNA-binding response OmpR family regulator
MLSASLANAGFKVAGPFNEGSQASEWLRVHTPVAAVLDVALWDGAAFDLAHELCRRDVPFLFYTGWTDREQIPLELREVIYLKKPIPAARVTRLVVKLASGQQGDAAPEIERE